MLPLFESLELRDASLGETVPGARSREMAQVEAVLFLAGKPLSAGELARHANLANGTVARRVIDALKMNYQTVGSAWNVERLAGGYQLVTIPAVGPPLLKWRGPAGVGISAPALETLTLVAYRQPVTRATLEAIRGVKCGELLHYLMDQHWVRMVGRSKELGRPVLYGTTPEFLRMFGLRELEDLPHWDKLRIPGDGQAQTAWSPEAGADAEQDPSAES